MTNHPTITAYKAGCRCTECRAINAAYKRRHRAATNSGYDKALTSAVREAARRWRTEHPEQWAPLLDSYLRDQEST